MAFQEDRTGSEMRSMRGEGARRRRHDCLSVPKLRQEEMHHGIRSSGRQTMGAGRSKGGRVAMPRL